nr:toll/interleukin-1 receptor domain-containing protein [uncultured Duganella sp.]
MPHPIFFSFANDAKGIATTIKSRFSDDLVYSYIRTGVEGDNFPDEILEEIHQCKIFVIFLSSNYISSKTSRPWCRRELITAMRRVEAGTLKSFFIVQTDKTPLDSEIHDPDNNVAIDALKVFRDKSRAFGFPVDTRIVEHRIASELARQTDTELPILVRESFQRSLRSILKGNDYSTKRPVVFVSGFHGTGRKTLIRSVMGSDFKHLTEQMLPLDNADGPEDLLRLIWGEVLQKSVGEQRAMMNNVAKDPSALGRYYGQLGNQLVTRRLYLVLSKEDSIGYGQTLPSWMPSVINKLQAAVQPLLFITIARPLPDHVKRDINDISEIAIPALEEDESLQLTHMVIGAFDPKRASRWVPHIPFILESGANSPQLLVDIVKLASKRSSLDFLQQHVQADIDRFDQRVVQVLDWAWDKVKDNQEKLLLLDILNSLGVAHIDTFEELFGARAAYGKELYELVQLGIVEHLNESTFRISPALRRKLNLYLLSSELKRRTSEILRKFAQNVHIGEDQFGGVALTNNLQIKLAENANIAEADMAFVTGAMLFKAGWEKYRKHEYAGALTLLKRSFLRIEKIRDESTRLEIARYYGLAAVREGADTEFVAACTYLQSIGNFSLTMRDRGKATSLFIQGFSAKINQEFVRACSLFGDSLNVLPGAGSNDGQRAQILNELIQCLLKLPAPDYGRAVELGFELCRIRETPNNLDVLLRALLAQTYYQANLGKEKIQKNFSEMHRREEQLRVKCESSNLSFHASRIIDRLEEEALEEVRADDLPYGSLDLQKSIDACHDAYIKYSEQSFLCRKWDLQLHTERDRDWSSLHAEVTKFLANGNLDRRGKGIATRIKILTFGLSNTANREKAIAEFEKSKSNGILPKLVAKDVRRKLDLPNFETSRMLYRSAADLEL